MIRDIGRQIRREDGFESTNVAVFFGRQEKGDEPGEIVPDPCFDGKGPERTVCNRCGGHMGGCRHGARNTLDRKYLSLADRLGAVVKADTDVIWVKPVPGAAREQRRGTPKRTT